MLRRLEGRVDSAVVGRGPALQWGVPAAVCSPLEVSSYKMSVHALRALIHYRVSCVPVHLRLTAPNRMCPISIIFKGDRTNVFILENRIRLNWSGRMSRVVKSNKRTIPPAGLIIYGPVWQTYDQLDLITLETFCKDGRANCLQQYSDQQIPSYIYNTCIH